MKAIAKPGWIAAVMLLLAAGPGWAADAPACDKPDTPLRPVLATHTIPPYPAMSVMTQEEGTVLLGVHIGADGVPTETQILTSSGSARLDEAAQDHVKTVWRWTAPTRNCQPVAVNTRISINWDLKEAPEPEMDPRLVNLVMTKTDYPAGAWDRKEKGGTVVTVTVGAAGAVLAAKVAQGSGFDELDAKALEIVKAKHWSPGAMDGKPVNTNMFIAVLWPLDDPVPDLVRQGR